VDKVSLVLRKMLKDPEKRWVVRDFTGTGGSQPGNVSGSIKSDGKKGVYRKSQERPK
jgi:hypothetical protein